MTTYKRISLRSDVLGTIASSLCLLHCLATPLFFTLDFTTSIVGAKKYSLWWGSLDILFISISLLAVFWSARNTSKQWMKYALWISWAMLAAIILNEKFHIIELVVELIYLPSIALVFLHIYNRKYCQCANENCCSNSSKIQLD